MKTESRIVAEALLNFMHLSNYEWNKITLFHAASEKNGILDFNVTVH